MVSVMSRYIDISDLDIPSDENDYDELVAFADKIAAMVTGIWSIDIVRCRECLEYDDDWCMYWQNVINPDDFCSYGEREGE